MLTDRLQALDRDGFVVVPAVRIGCADATGLHCRSPRHARRPFVERPLKD